MEGDSGKLPQSNKSSNCQKERLRMRARIALRERLLLLAGFAVFVIWSLLQQNPLSKQQLVKVVSEVELQEYNRTSVEAEELRLQVAELSQALEEQTARLQRENRWPKQSLAKLDQLLTEYAVLHADILSGKVADGKFIRWICGWCYGWGDRIRGIITVLTLAIIHKRAFVIELNQVGVHLNELYNDSFIRWTHKPVFKNDTLVSYSYPKSCNFLREGVANASSSDMITVFSNLDCSGKFASLLPGWKDTDGGIEDVLNWRGVLMDKVFPLTMKLRLLIIKTIPNGVDVGIHIRSGIINNRVGTNLDATRFHGTPDALAEIYTECLTKVHPGAAPNVFIAADNATFQAEVTKRISSLAKVVDSQWIGSLGHIQNQISGGKKMVWRMMVDFQILRRAKLLLVAPSGFSLVAFKFRVYADSRAYAPIASKDVQKCEEIFMNYTSKPYGPIDASRRVLAEII